MSRTNRFVFLFLLCIVLLAAAGAAPYAKALEIAAPEQALANTSAGIRSEKDGRMTVFAHADFPHGYTGRAEIKVFLKQNSSKPLYTRTHPSHAAVSLSRSELSSCRIFITFRAAHGDESISRTKELFLPV